ncbi:syntaxin 1a [Echinococcus multilocularis]|uniref:Syntaxin 1a n=1 Tax=Echinococcus multilocularis TaxID=6211 RepID=A0A068Y5Y6_ECHMU|nr:syntaxin 1a [Echinococcus multilocularis]
MPKDLLAALKEENGYNNHVSNDSFEDGSYLSAFFSQVEQIRGEIDKIATLVAEIKQKHSEILAAPNQDERTKARVEEIMAEIKRCAGGVRCTLKQLDLSIQQEEKAGGDVADIRIKRCQHQTIGRRFVEVMQNYSKAQTDYRDANKKRILRQMAIADRNITDEELEDMLESGNPQIFTQSILADTQLARQTLSEIEARHQDIIKLEQSIKELHDMFQDLATLVDSQQETIDKIEYNVDQAKDYIETAKTDVEKAVIYQKKSRKKKIIIGVVVALILLIIIISLATSLTSR